MTWNIWKHFEASEVWRTPALLRIHFIRWRFFAQHNMTLEEISVRAVHFYRPSELIYNKASWNQATCIQVLSVPILRLTREITFYNNSLEDFLTFHNMTWNIWKHFEASEVWRTPALLRIHFIRWRFFAQHNMTLEAISVRAVQGVSHRKKVFPQTLPNKLSMVTSI